MKNDRLLLSILIFVLVYCSCNPGKPGNADKISANQEIIAKGDSIFDKNCSSCHNFKQNGIGPQLGGITDSMDISWLRAFIKDPKKLVESGDYKAISLQKKYKVLMPSFSHLQDEELSAILAFMTTHKKPEEKKSRSGLLPIENPLPDTIAMSNLVLGLQPITQIPASSDGGKLPLTRITKMDFEPGTGINYVVDIRGKLYRLQDGHATIYMDMAQLMPKFTQESGLGTGFGSFAFHPDFAKNGLLYTTHAEKPGSGNPDFNYEDTIKVSLQWVVTEWKTDHPESPVFKGKNRELMRVNVPTVMHGVQEITFNPLAKPSDKDYGMLYIGIGDGGSVDDNVPFLVDRKDRILGTIVRINPRGNNSVNSRYGIPADNPFVKTKNALPEIYALGFRNPHRLTWIKSGELLASNIGGAQIESVNLIKPGADFGWPVREGNFMVEPDNDWTKVYPLPKNDSSFHFSYPVVAYDHNGGTAAISGGFEYWGNSIPALKGKYLFGDIPSGHLYYVNISDLKQGHLATVHEWQVTLNGNIKTLRELCQTSRVDLHFGRDAKGELYILTKPDGKIYKLVQ